MLHQTEFIVESEVEDNVFRFLSLSQTLVIALVCAVVAFAFCAAGGVSWLMSAVAAIATFNIVPLLLGIVLAAR